MIRLRLGGPLLLLLLPACGPTGPVSHPPGRPDAADAGPPADAAPATPLLSGPLEPGEAERWLSTGIDPVAALELVAFLDARFREPGNAPYREALDELERRLRAAGFGTVPELLLERWTLREDAPTWEPLSGSLEVVAPAPEKLLAFGPGNDRDRTLVLIGSPGTAGPIEADLLLEGEGDPTKCAVLARGRPEAAYGRLADAGAVLVLLSADARYEGAVSGEDVIPFGDVPGRVGGPVAMRLSRRVEARLRELLHQAGDEPVVLRFQAAVRLERGPVEALHAEVVGGEAPGLVVLAHLDEPGAEDNGSGVATAVGVAEALGSARRDHPGMPRPLRSIHLVVGPELSHSREAVRRLGARIGWGVALDQVGRPIGDPAAEPGATRALLERPPDVSLRHPAGVGGGSGWLSPGESPEVSGTPPPPSLLADLLLGLLRRGDPRWESHPYEGGSDHVPLVDDGIPAALIWKFPDPTYHTNRDRLDPSVVSGEELERVARAVLVLAASVGWEDGCRALEPAVEVIRSRAEALLASGDDGAACEWGVWLRGALAEWRRFLGGAEPSAAAGAAAAPLESWADTLEGRCVGAGAPGR